MLDPRSLTHAQLAAIVADVQAILWQESRMLPLPDCPLDYDDRRSELAEILGMNAANFDLPLIGDAAAQSLNTTTSRVRLVASYTAGRFPQVYAGLKGHGADGVILKRRKALYAKQHRHCVESRDWLKRRFAWD